MQKSILLLWNQQSWCCFNTPWVPSNYRPNVCMLMCWEEFPGFFRVWSKRWQSPGKEVVPMPWLSLPKKSVPLFPSFKPGVPSAVHCLEVQLHLGWSWEREPLGEQHLSFAIYFSLPSTLLSLALSIPRTSQWSEENYHLLSAYCVPDIVLGVFFYVYLE